MSELGWVHTAFAGVAMSAGAAVCLRPKGTRWHRTLGHLYATSMLGLIATALSIYRLTGRFGPFHVAALVALVTVGMGLYTVLARQPRRRWIEIHATWMSWSYVGLLAAFASEALTRFVRPLIADAPGFRWPIFWSAVVVATAAVLGIGAWVIRARLPTAVASTPERMRQGGQDLASRASPTPLSSDSP